VNTNEQLMRVRTEKCGQEMAKVARGYSHSDLRYWQDKVFRKRYLQDGSYRETADYSVRLQFAGRREYFNLGTPNKAAAAATARQIHQYLRANGWEATLAKYKPRPGQAVVGSITTVGEFVTALRSVETGNLQTFEDYAGRFYRIAAWVAGIETSARRFDVKGQGHTMWLAKVGAVLLSAVTPEKIQAWKQAQLLRAGQHRAKERSARVSVNSVLRRAASLFAKRRLERAGLTDIQNPFATVEYERRPSTRYRSTFDVAQVAAVAQMELGPEEYKAFLLAAFCGLRRGEIDALEWSAFRWDQSVLRLEVTEHFSGKGEESIADVALEEEVLAVFRGFHAAATSRYVIASAISARHVTTYRHYRCKRVFHRLSSWLRAHGVTGKSPIHTLRKEYGSQVCDRLGIYAASQALRHADIGVTARHYLETKRRITPGLGSLLKQPQNVTDLTSADRDGSVGQPESAHG
jgi:integrase